MSNSNVGGFRKLVLGLSLGYCGTRCDKENCTAMDRQTGRGHSLLSSNLSRHHQRVEREWLIGGVCDLQYFVLEPGRLCEVDKVPFFHSRASRIHTLSATNALKMATHKQ